MRNIWFLLAACLWACESTPVTSNNPVEPRASEADTASNPSPGDTVSGDAAVSPEPDEGTTGGGQDLPSQEDAPSTVDAGVVSDSGQAADVLADAASPTTDVGAAADAVADAWLSDTAEPVDAGAPVFIGSEPTSCGSPDQGLEPVDCTMYGDENAVCVFSNHCMCSLDEGFECETPFGDWIDVECAPGSVCVPSGATDVDAGMTDIADVSAGTGDTETGDDDTVEDIGQDLGPSEPTGWEATSCGSPDQGLEPVDCTMYGDVNAFCVFSNHCGCSLDEGFECEEPFGFGAESECAPGSVCVPAE